MPYHQKRYRRIYLQTHGQLIYIGSEGMLAVLAMAAVENHLRDGINCNSFAWFESNPA